jgi:5'-methylthioadenosine phosphorylase
LIAAPIRLAVLGGSGFYDMPGLSDIEERVIDTPFGSPSDAIRVGTLEGERVAFLARHGRKHTHLPSELPQRANFWALKTLGVEAVFAISAVGSLREELRPKDLVVPSQLVDRLRGNRPETFFGDGVVGHIGFAEPFCESLRNAVLHAAHSASIPAVNGGTLVVIEGPSFGTKAESHLYRQWGADIVGMTTLPEARLAREAEICYASLSAVTDYDSWHESEEAVTANAVFAVLKQNVEASQAVVRGLAATVHNREACDCRTTLDSSMVTAPRDIPEGRKADLGPILERWLAARGDA